MRFDSFDFLSPVCNKVISKSESVMNLNIDKQNESKAKKSISEGDPLQNKAFANVGECDLLEHDKYSRTLKLLYFCKLSNTSKYSRRRNLFISVIY